MARTSFALTFLFGLIILTVWQFETIDFSRQNPRIGKRNHTKKSIRETQDSHGISNQTKPWLIIFWSTYFGQQLNIQLAWKTGECPVACEVTTNRSRASEAKGFIVHARDPHMIPPNDSVPWILLTQENPVYTPVLTKPSFMSKFKLLRSYRLDSDFPDPTFWMPAVAPPIPFKDKDGFVMAAFSNCERVRTEYMRQLMKFVEIDSYGACLRNKHGLVARYGKKNGTDFRDVKTELAKKYKFTLVFFNQDCDYFVDAQLSHALQAGSVPVIMSTDKLDEFLPGNLRHAVIKVRDFKSPRQLAEYLKYLNTNETEYNKYLEWKWKGFGNITGTVIGDFWMPTYPMYCQICVALSQGRVHKEGLKPITCKPRRFEDWGITNGA
ncbi:GDP-fucose protein O-fucosyltransferase 4-like [Oculina patagonica]